MPFHTIVYEKLSCLHSEFIKGVFHPPYGQYAKGLQEDSNISNHTV